MGIEYRQSAIREVRDQLLLDYADDKYLNIVTANMGLTRPAFGFNDDTWRAIAKIVGLNYKQITTQFEQVFAVMFGPKVTQATSLTTDTSVGDRSLFVRSTENIPQIGTVILDEGLATEESHQYCLINRYTNEIMLDTALIFAHSAYDRDASSLLLTTRPSFNQVVLADTSMFPTTYPYPVVLGRGTANEEVVEVLNNDIASRTLTVTALTNTHTNAFVSPIFSDLAIDYTANTYYLNLDSSLKFPDEGTVKLSNPPEFEATSGTVTTVDTTAGSFKTDQHAGRTVVFFGDTTPALANVASTIASNTDSQLTFAAIATPPASGDSFYIATTVDAVSGSVNDVTAAASTFTAGEYAGSEVTFVGNVTAALAGQTAKIVSNTATTLTFESAIAAVPVVGDKFYLRPIIHYTRVSHNEGNLLLRNAVPSNLPEGTRVELLEEVEDALFCPVKVNGSLWDVIQVEPRHVELLLPDELEPDRDLRSASYLHPEYAAVRPSTTLGANALVGDAELTLTSAVGFPVQGIMELDGGTEYVGYYRPLITQSVVVGSSNNNTTGAQIYVNGPLTVGSLVGDQLFVGDAPAKTITANTANLITLDSPFENEQWATIVADGAQASWYDPFIVRFRDGNVLANAFTAGDAADDWELNYAGTDLVEGDLWDYDNVHAGPYVYDFGSQSPTNLENVGQLTTTLQGPMTLQVDQLAIRDAIEVDDASFLPTSGFPYNILVGSFSSSRESAEVIDIGLRSLTETDVAVVSVASQTYLEVTSLGTGSGFRFPNANGYRVRVGRGTANDEIIYVTDVDGVAVPPQLICEAMVNPHGLGEVVELVSDVISVSNLRNDHVGVIDITDRKNLFPATTSTDREQADICQAQYDDITLSTTVGLDSSGTITLNYGHGVVDARNQLVATYAAGVGSVFLVDSTLFPTSGTPYPIKLGAGTYNEEVAFVTGNNTGTGELTLANNTRFDHQIEDDVLFTAGEEESIEYSSIDGNTLRFSSAIVLESNHHIDETALGSQVLTNIHPAGYDFPLRMPPSLRSRLQYLFDLLRAAGVQVTIISAR